MLRPRELRLGSQFNAARPAAMDPHAMDSDLLAFVHSHAVCKHLSIRLPRVFPRKKCVNASLHGVLLSCRGSSEGCIWVFVVCFLARVGSFRPAGGHDSCQHLRRRGESHGFVGKLGNGHVGNGRFLPRFDGV